MRLSGITFFLSLFSTIFVFSNQVLADPVNNGEPLSPQTFTCPSQKPRFCPTGTPCPDCPDCPEPSLCPISSCTPTPTETSSVCQGYYQLDFRYTGAYKKTDVKIDQTGASELSCFEKMVNGVIDKLPGSGLGEFDSSEVLDKKGSQLAEKTGKWFSAILWDTLLQKVGSDRSQLSNYNEHKKFINCTGGYVGVTHNGWAQIGGGKNNGNYTSQPGCQKGSVYLDSSCKMIDAAHATRNLEKCGDIDLYAQISTPISLVWSDSFKGMPSTLVNFKLNPYADRQSWLWRGSEALPLLVYDPEHTGVIISATQLFGSWTFGGNGLASLIEGTSQGTPWKDGYEALSKMDKNLDGKVSGAELKDLALWFDKNQDGISQKGEVKTLSEVSVKTLFYMADKKEEGAIVATNGYEKEVDGKIVVASSMDWMEKGLKDGFDVLLDSAHSKGLTNGQSKMQTKESSYDSSEYAKDVAPEVYGVWGWTLEQPAKGSGYLSLDPSEEGIAGISISQLGVLSAKDVDSQVLFSHFSGTSHKNAEGLAEVKFEVAGENGVMLLNTASLSKDGTELIGKTVVSGSSVSETGTYEYAWKAVRLK